MDIDSTDKMLERYGQQIKAYKELNEQFKQGQGYGGIIINYYPLTPAQIAENKKRQEKRDMDAYLAEKAKKEEAKNKNGNSNI